MEFVARLDAHSSNVTREIYAVSTPEQDAKRAKELVQVMIGGPVAVPTPADISATTVDHVIARFALAEDDVDITDKPGKDSEPDRSNNDDDACQLEAGDGPESSDPDIPLEPIDVEEYDESPPPMNKRVRLAGFHTSAASSSAGVLRPPTPPKVWEGSSSSNSSSSSSSGSSSSSDSEA
jgi:hypothetical protein